LHILGSVAQFERDLIIERTRVGLASAVKRGTRLGAPVIWTAEMVKRARALEKTGDMTRGEVAKMLGVSERTLFRGLKAAREHDEIVGS
jgi:DNA invertase Pin-like site-specific DNA recombinase